MESLIHKTMGGLAALLSAAVWAYGSILFLRLGKKVTPLGMNLVKGIIGILYLGIVALLMGIEPVSTKTFVLLGISGFLGIALGDTFFFKSLMYLGPRLTILLGTLGPVLTVIIAVVFLREKPSFLAWAGIFFILTGVTWVLWERTPRQKIEKNWGRGIKYALLSTLCISIGIIFAKKGVASCSTLQATFIRISCSVVGLAAWGGATHQLKNWLIPFKEPRILKFIFFAAFVVIFGGFWLFIIALKYIDASIAAVLNSTTPLFILPMAAFMLKEKISPRAIIGAVIAVGGITLIFIS